MIITKLVPALAIALSAIGSARAADVRSILTYHAGGEPNFRKTIAQASTQPQREWDG